MDIIVFLCKRGGMMQYAAFSCGGLNNLAIPVANLISTIINTIKILTPVVLIVFGLIDMTKSTIAQKEDEMKKAQKLFIKRIISAILVFFIIAIVQFSFSLLANAAGERSFLECVSCFINGVDSTGACK